MSLSTQDAPMKGDDKPRQDDGAGPRQTSGGGNSTGQPHRAESHDGGAQKQPRPKQGAGGQE